MKKLETYAEDIRKAENSPGVLANILIEMSADYGTAANNKIRYEVEYSEFYLNNKNLGGEDKVSDKAVQMMFIQKGNGQQMRNNEIYLKGLERLMSNLKAVIRVREGESRNQF